MLPGNTNPVQKITITRSDQLTTTDPRSAVAGFPFLPPTPDQRASYHTIPKGDSTLEFPWVPDLSSPHRVAPIEVTADRWTTSSLVVPPMVPLAMPTWNEERGTPTRGGLQLTMSPGFIQACNTTSLSQCDIIPQTTYHTPFYFSANIPVQSRDKENHEQPRLVIANTPTTHHHAQENHQLAGLTHQTNTASIPTSEDHSLHFWLPTEAGGHPTHASGIDPNWVPSRQDAPAGPIQQQASGRECRQALRRVYDKPGNKPAVAYEPDVPWLQELSRQRGGKDFAIGWIPKAFTKGVKAEALRRTLSEDEINAVDHDHGFRLSQAYDGFLEKVEDRFECGLCAEGKRANWKNKKDAIRHFQKFHFGIGQTCGTCNNTYYSHAELNRHVCSSVVTPADVA